MSTYMIFILDYTWRFVIVLILQIYSEIWGHVQIKNLEFNWYSKNKKKILKYGHFVNLDLNWIQTGKHENIPMYFV